MRKLFFVLLKTIFCLTTGGAEKGDGWVEERAVNSVVIVLVN